eukprot:TRINITY_DN27654_c0_g1_i1.p5 TRINITY_DN27654_c0_g1~~TRINITY_DN27654_c0_g1_i1.p5  ORF type:complete len:117 (+),score=31.99 TRINITY_DN27654_c0_g1_i1:510-860(+)
MRMLVTGDPVDAATAAGWGLVSDLVDDSGDAPEQRQAGGGELRRRTLALAAHIASKPAATIAQGKRVLSQQLQLPLDEAYSVASEAMCSGLQSQEAQEGIEAFLKKRRPVWPNNFD